MKPGQMYFLDGEDYEMNLASIVDLGLYCNKAGSRCYGVPERP